MALSDIIDKLSCSLADALGTGLRGCDFNFENMESIAILPSGTAIPASAAYDRDYIRSLQKSGQWIPLNRVYSFDWQTGDDEVETSDTKGIEAVTRKGLYKFEVMFRNGIYQQKVLNSLEGFGRWDVIFFDEDGNQLHVTTSSGGIRGFSTGRFSVSPIEFKNGKNSLKTRLTVQFTKTSQFNNDIGFVGADDLTFNPDEIEGVNQARLSIPTAPANAATDIVVKTVLDKDGSTFVTGLVDANFLVKVDGATVAATAVADANAKTYTLTVPALNTGQVVTVDLYDTPGVTPVIEVGQSPDDILYQAKTATTTVV
ncbi:MAG: hypothetical protein AAF039_12815 [Bacteroidota bacterium]